MPMLETGLSHLINLEDEHLVAGILNPSFHILMELGREQKETLLMKYCRVLGLLNPAPQVVVPPQPSTSKAASGMVSKIMSRLLDKPTTSSLLWTRIS